MAAVAIGWIPLRVSGWELSQCSARRAGDGPFAEFDRGKAPHSRPERLLQGDI